MTFNPQNIIDWQKKYGRHALPWQKTVDPYARWLAETMLQQTQVQTVIPYYEKFLQVFPTVFDLAGADEEQVLALWAGLGYYSRARNLHRCAQIVCRDYKGRFPLSVEQLTALPGIGRSTAGAVIAAVTDRPTPMLDGNVKRIFARVFKVSDPKGSSAFEKTLWKLAEAHLPGDNGRAFSQGLMDMGALICKKSDPLCAACPFNRDCAAFSDSTVTAYPVSAVKKQRPQKQLYWLIYTDGDRVLLEQRLGKGVWQKLWSLPETEECPADAEPLEAIKHDFSHYRLIAIPLMMKTAIPTKTVGRWVRRCDLDQIGIPTPVKALLLKQIL